MTSSRVRPPLALVVTSWHIKMNSALKLIKIYLSLILENSEQCLKSL